MTTRHRLRPTWASCCVVLALLAASAWAAPAQAWTRTSIEGVAAHLDVEAERDAHVALQLDVRVHGGWLSKLELTGLDADLALDPDKPPCLITEDGAKLTPDAQVTPGRVVLSFGDRRAAPRRGLHRLGLVYTTRLAPSGAHGGARVGWSLPPWSEDLENVHVWVDAPRGTALPAAGDGDDAAVRRERIDRGARTLLHFERAQLPRTVSFAIELVLPSDLDATPLASGDELRPVRHTPAVLWTCAIVLALALTKRRAVHAICARHAARALPLIALPPALRSVAMVAFAAAASLSYDAHASLGLLLLASVVLLALERGFAPGAALPSATQRRRTQHMANMLARAEAWFGTAAWLDATAPLGLGLLASAYALAALRLRLSPHPGLWLEALLLVTPLWLTSTRLQIHRHPNTDATA